jgi:hypothetical protein
MNGTSVNIKTASTDDRKLAFWLDDGRIVSAPLSWYPSLHEASPAERKLWRLSGGGYGVHWPALDYGLSAECILGGHKEHPNAQRFTREFRAKNRTTHGLVRSPKSGCKLVPV